MIFQFDHFRLDSTSFEVWRDETRLEAQPQVLELLIMLIENRDRVVSREEIFDQIWKNRIVSDTTLSSRIKSLRKLLGDDGVQQKFVRTIHGRGFRFHAEVVETQGSQSAPAENLKSPAEFKLPKPEALLRTEVEALKLPDKPSIAVLPFLNMSGDPEQEYFSDGITEDIITELSRFHSLFVIARNSSFAFKGEAVGLAAVAERLGVRYILEGSVRKAGERVRITAQLIEAISLSHLWAERYDGQLEDIFSLQDDITERVVWALAGHLEQAEIVKARRTGSADPTAYDLSLRALGHLYRYTPDDTEKAIRLLERAIEMVPESGRALSRLASAYKDNFWWTGDRDWIDRSDRTAMEALERSDPEDWTEALLAYIAGIRGDFSRAARHMERAMAINPHDRTTVMCHASIQKWRGDIDAVLEATGRLRRLDPINPAYVDEEEAGALYLAGRYEECITVMERSMPISYPRANAYLAAAYGQVGDKESAHQAWERCVALRPGFTLESFAAESLYENPADSEHWLDGLRKAEVPE